MSNLFISSILPLALLLLILLQQHRQKAHQEQIVDSLRGKRFWRIFIAQPEYVDKLWKLHPAQARGVLIDEGDQLRIRGRWQKTGEIFDTVVPKDSTRISWYGNPSIKSNNLYWAALNTPTGKLMFAADTGMVVLGSREGLADIFRSVFPDYPLALDARQDFALEKNFRSLAALVAFFGLVLFALIDTFVISRYELIEAQILQLITYPLFVPVSMAGLLGIGLLLYRTLVAGQVPSREALVLSLLFASACAGATFPVLKRVDQVLAEFPTQNYRYRVVDNVVHLEPTQKDLGLPRLRFSNAKEYWAQFPVGIEVTVPLLRGPLGLWQLDHERFNQPLVAFYERLQENPRR